MKKVGSLLAVAVCLTCVLTDKLWAQTEQEILAMHETMMAAINEHDLDGIMAAWAEDGVYDFVALPEPLVGKEQIRQFFADLFNGFPDFHVEQSQTLVSGNTVVAECATTGSHLGEWMGIPATGASPNAHIHMNIHEYEGNKIKKTTSYIDMATLMMSLGVMPVPDLPEFKPSFTLPTPEPSTLPYMEMFVEMTTIWNTYNLPDYSKYFSDDGDYLISSVGQPMTRGAFIASQEMYQFAFPDIQAKVDQRDMGNGWFVEEELFTGTHLNSYLDIAPTGRSIAVRGVLLGHIENGLVTYFHSYWDSITLLTQFGLPISGDASIAQEWSLYR